ncbi:conserved hypothetical protein [Ricinus communis]|uniref:Uncharacterized protein n=1 Tax=Ricinus communis TaxID=3988 RepID=B9SYH8_RICCO|nr:conserved hypothetical protein [Ricinus communis]
MLNLIKDGLVSVYCEGEAKVELIDENQEVMDKDAQVNDNAEETVVGGQTNDIAGQQDILSDSKDNDYKLVKVSETDDSVEDSDFSLEEEEHLEARRNLRWARVHEVESFDDDNEAIIGWRRVILARERKKAKVKAAQLNKKNKEAKANEINNKKDVN